MNPIIIIYFILFTYLTFCSITDIHSKRINILISGIYLLIGIFFNMYFIKNDLIILFMNLSTGLLLALIAKITKGAIGYGDSLIFFVISFYIPSFSTLYILFFSLVTASLFSILLLLKKYSKKYRIPFAPFIQIGFFIFLIL